MPNIRKSKDKQVETVEFINSTYNDYRWELEERRNLYLEIYDAMYTFNSPQTVEWAPDFKVNKAHEIVNKVLPRLIAKNPKWIVRPRTDAFYEGDEKLTGDERQANIERNNKFSRAIQDYLTVLFKQKGQRERLKGFAKEMLVYWNSFAQVRMQYEIMRTKEGNKNTKEKVIWQFPTIDPVSWYDMYYNPNFVFFEDMAWVLRVKERVRLWELYQNPDFFNLDKIEDLSNTKFTWEEGYREQVANITGISDYDANTWVDKHNLTLVYYYGYYPDPENPREERLYEIVTVNKILIIWMKEITQLPFVDLKWHENTEVYFATGLVEPIMPLMNELNFKKNAAALHINHALYRSWFYDPNSGINPEDLIDKPNNIVMVNNWMQAALNWLQEINPTNLPPEYFQEQADFNRDIQALTHTIDTSSAARPWQTDTATGARIAFFESNSVIAELTKNFEEAMSQLAYKLLEVTYDNIEDNIILNKIDEEGFLELNKELFRNALERYEIKIEANSSSFDSIEQERQDAIAKANIWLQAQQAWIPINGQELYKDVFSTFENVDLNKLFPEQVQTPWVGWQISQPEQQQEPTAELVQQVAQWNITSWV